MPALNPQPGNKSSLFCKNNGIGMPNDAAPQLAPNPAWRLFMV
jgi:hypothetical protein